MIIHSSRTIYQVNISNHSEIKWWQLNIWQNFQVQGHIDLIFGMRVYNHMLQIKFEIHSGWLIFRQLTAAGLWNLAIFSCHYFFFTIIWDIDLVNVSPFFNSLSNRLRRTNYQIPKIKSTKYLAKVKSSRCVN
jgi:hypothetical protein